MNIFKLRGLKNKMVDIKISDENQRRLNKIEMQLKKLAKDFSINQKEKQFLYDLLKNPRDKKLTVSFAPINDDCTNAINVSYGSYTGETLTATVDGSASCGASDISPDVWYSFTATANETISITTDGSDYDTVLSVHTGCPGTTSNEIICDDDCGWSLTSCVTINATANTTYLIRVSGYSGDSGNFQLNIFQSGTFSGTVTDSQTSFPLADVEIDIFNEDGYNVGYAFTDNNGNYISSGLQPGNYFAVTYNYQGYIDELYDNIYCPGWSCNILSGTPITVVAGSNTPNINFALDLGGRITGTVSDSNTGLPISCEIEFFDIFGFWLGSSFTDDYGNYIIPGLPSGVYYARTYNWDQYIDELYNNITCIDCDPTQGTPIFVQLGSDTTGINFALDKGGTISGIITDATNKQPISGIHTHIFDAAGQQIDISYNSNSSGYYISSSGLLTGTYYAISHNYYGYIDEIYDNIACANVYLCNPLVGTPISVTKGNETTGINFELDVGGIITGNVKDTTGQNIANAYIDIYDASGNWISWASSNNAGDYYADGLPTGNYYAAAGYYGFAYEIYNNIPCSWYFGCDFELATSIPVVKGSTTSGINFQLDSGAVLTAWKPWIDDYQSQYPNGIMEEGETVNLVSALENVGTQTAISVYSIISSTDPININDNYASYTNIPAGFYAFCDDCYNITIPSGNRPSQHWDIHINEVPYCSGSTCSINNYNFLYHIGNSFSDVPPSQIFYAHIEKLFHSGITGGCASNSYCPNQLISREQMAKFICNSINSASPNYCATSACENIFADVPSSNAFCSYIEALYKMGIVGGCQNQPLMYCPAANSQRQAMAKFVCEGMKAVDTYNCILEPCTGIFADVNSSNPFCSYIESLYNDGVIGGCGQGIYCPNAYVARDQMAKFLVNGFSL